MIRRKADVSNVGVRQRCTVAPGATEISASVAGVGAYTARLTVSDTIWVIDVVLRIVAHERELTAGWVTGWPKRCEIYEGR